MTTSFDANDLRYRKIFLLLLLLLLLWIFYGVVLTIVVVSRLADLTHPCTGFQQPVRSHDIFLTFNEVCNQITVNIDDSSEFSPSVLYDVGRVDSVAALSCLMSTQGDRHLTSCIMLPLWRVDCRHSLHEWACLLTYEPKYHCCHTCTAFYAILTIVT